MSELSRSREAFRAYLLRMAEDADLAIAFASAYETMNGEERDAQLSVLDEELATLGVPAVAVLGPLFAVEEDLERRAAIAARLPSPLSTTMVSFATKGAPRRLVLAERVYLDFIGATVVTMNETLACTRVPLTRLADLEVLLAAELTATPLEAIIDELAEAVVRLVRRAPPPRELLRHASLFNVASHALAVTAVAS